MRTTRIIAALVAGTLAAGALLAAPLAANAATPTDGHVDSVTLSGLNAVRVRGWAAVDAKTTTVAISIQGTVIEKIKADRPRADVAAALGTTSKAYGFDEVVPVPPGRDSAGRVTVAASIASSTGATKVLNRQYLIGVPSSAISHLDSAVGACPTPGTTTPRIRLTGWSFDPQKSAGPGTVDVYTVSTTGVTKAFRHTANLSRADVKKKYGLSNATVGFSFEIPADKLSQFVVFGISQGPSKAIKTVTREEIPLATC